MKLTYPLWAPAVLAVLSIAPAAKAQQGPPRGGHRPPPNALIQALDTDKDHKISADELKNAAAALAKLDTNGDGKISKDELRPKPPKDAPEGADAKDDGAGPPPPPEDGGGKGGQGKGHGGGGGPGGKGGDHQRPKDPVMEALDTNGDGELSADEIAAASTSLAKLDTDGDGAISESEFRPKPPTDGKDSKDSKTK